MEIPRHELELSISDNIYRMRKNFAEQEMRAKLRETLISPPLSGF